MEKINFIGAYDKTDSIMYICKNFNRNEEESYNS